MITKIIMCEEVSPPQGQAVIQVTTWQGLNEIYGGGDLVAFIIPKKHGETENWVIGEFVSACYVGDELLEEYNNGLRNVKKGRGSKAVRGKTKQRKVLRGHRDDKSKV